MRLHRTLCITLSKERRSVLRLAISSCPYQSIISLRSIFPWGANFLLPKELTGVSYGIFSARGIGSPTRKVLSAPARYTKILGRPLSSATPRSNDSLRQFPAREGDYVTDIRRTLSISWNCRLWYSSSFHVRWLNWGRIRECPARICKLYWNVSVELGIDPNIYRGASFRLISE